MFVPLFSHVGGYFGEQGGYSRRLLREARILVRPHLLDVELRLAASQGRHGIEGKIHEESTPSTSPI